MRKELIKINKLLPAAVYIPFVSQRMRQFTVLQIVAEEARIFKTKERAPVLLCLEVCRPSQLRKIDGPDLKSEEADQKHEIDDQIANKLLVEDVDRISEEDEE